jgi:hypothetical protein
LNPLLHKKTILPDPLNPPATGGQFHRLQCISLKVKAQLLLKKMKSSLDISWNEKGKLKYKGKAIKVVDLVNDVLNKRKYFNPQ